jgi:hypothetical protein
MPPLRLVLVAALAAVTGAPPSYAMAGPAPTAATASDVEPAAVQALARMTAYLSTLTAFDIKVDTSQDIVMTDGQKVRLDGANRYIVRRPDAFMVEVATPWKVRKLLYDGKTLTLHAPELGYYASADAPPTIRATLELIGERYGLQVPLQDLFRWTDPVRGDGNHFKGAFGLGARTIDGVDTDQYAFREENLDWQIWIQRGEQPLPLRVLIIDRTDLSRPQYEATLHWNLAPRLTADTFTLRPASGDKPIRLVAVNPQ